MMMVMITERETGIFTSFFFLVKKVFLLLRRIREEYKCANTFSILIGKLGKESIRSNRGHKAAELVVFGGRERG
jgi:hypothetical protein